MFAPACCKWPRKVRATTDSCLPLGQETYQWRLDREMLDVEYRDLLRGRIQRQGVAREHRNAQAAGDGLLDGFVAAQFHPDIDLEAVLPQAAVQAPGAYRSPARASETVPRARRLSGMRFLSASGWPSGASTTSRIFQERPAFDIQLLRRLSGDVEIVHDCPAAVPAPARGWSPSTPRRCRDTAGRTARAGAARSIWRW